MTQSPWGVDREEIFGFRFMKNRPGPPTALNLHLWHEVANHAVSYWLRLGDAPGLSAGFRRIAGKCRDTLERMISERG